MSDIEKTYVFYGSGMNTDDDSRYVREGDGRNRLNITITEDGKQGNVKTIKGNINIFKAPQRGINKTIGAIDNVENKSIVYFIYNSEGSHRIYEYRPFDNDRIDLILKSEDGANFNWTPYTEISGVVVDSICYFNDPIPRVINLNAARIANSTVIGVSSEVDIGRNGDGIYLYNGVYYEVTDAENKSVFGDDIPVTPEEVQEYVTNYLGEDLVDAFGELITI